MIGIPVPIASPSGRNSLVEGRCIMTRNRQFVIASLGIFVTVGCKDLGTFSDQQRVPPRPLTSQEQAIVAADNSFGFKLLNAVNQREAGKNVFISPLSVSMALGMTLNGAVGATRDSIARTLECAGLTQTDINTSYESLIALLTGLDPKVVFQIANSVWYRPELSVEEEFKTVNRQYFNAEINSLDFSDPAAAGAINNWVSRSTNGKITEIVNSPIPRDLMMYLINAIYFKGTWTYRFDPNLTHDDLFELPDGTKKPCKLMYQKGVFPYFADDQVQMIDLPYGDAGFSMTVVLPKPGINIDDFVSTLTQQQWEEWTAKLAKMEVVLSLPKFKLEYEKQLNDMLIAMGMGIAFSPSRADFTRIDVRGGLFISEVKHKTFVQVDEEGTEAAAVTSVGIGRTSIGPVMRIDRPFVLAIRENHSGTILFMGKITEPKTS
jgi:serpin B